MFRKFETFSAQFEMLKLVAEQSTILTLILFHIGATLPMRTVLYKICLFNDKGDNAQQGFNTEANVAGRGKDS
jgi:hypothetical protein